MTLQELKDTAFFRKSIFKEGFFEAIRDLGLWTVLANRFESFEQRSGNSSGEIPRKIHQIWLGGALPAAYRDWTKSWQEKHPRWEYRLWDDASIMRFGLRNEEAFRHSPSTGAKSDIARYEILERLGGIYADTDFECVRAFDDLAKACGFFAGTVFADSPQIANGLLGCSPGHPLLRKIVSSLGGPLKSRDGMTVIARTGADHVTRCFFEMEPALPFDDVIFPSTYFYPIPNFLGSRSPGSRTEYVKEWTHAIHYWETSWLRPHPIRAFLGRARRHLTGRGRREGRAPQGN